MLFKIYAHAVTREIKYFWQQLATTTTTSNSTAIQHET